MTINKIIDNGNIIFSPDGKLDSAAASEFEDVFIPAFSEAAPDGDVVIDFENIIYVSSAGLRVLFSGQKTADEKKCTLKFINVSDEIKEIFDIIGFSDIFNIE